MIKLLGYLILVDAFLSYILPNDHRLFWDLGRLVRGLIGLYLILGG